MSGRRYADGNGICHLAKISEFDAFLSLAAGPDKILWRSVMSDRPSPLWKDWRYHREWPMIVKIGEDERDQTLRYRGNRDDSRNDDRRIPGERSNHISSTSFGTCKCPQSER